jgi:hypothetical protein
MQYLGRTIRRLLLFTCFAGVTMAVASAQSLSDVRPGERVQLSVRDSLRQEPILPARQLMVGQFVRATADSVWLRSTGASEFSVARLNIKRASVSLGASRLRSALTFGAGLAFGFGVAVALDQSDEGHDHRTRDAWTAAGVGLGAGIIVGALSPYEHWRLIRR